MEKKNNTLMDGLNAASTIGFYLISPVIVGIVIGRFLDGYFASQPSATIAGIILGMITGMWAIYKKVMKEK